MGNIPIKEWLDRNKIGYCDLSLLQFTMPNVGVFGIVQNGGYFFDNSFNLILNSEVEKDVDYYCFQFGDVWYYIPQNATQNVVLTPLKYIGQASLSIDVSFPYLAIRGWFDLLNGSRSYDDWCTKAKFLGIDTLAITEKNTLGGALKFQLSCKKYGITPIIGLQVTIKCGSYFCQVKCYVKDSNGWLNLLLINKELNVINGGWIDVGRFLQLVEGLVVVLDTKYTDFEHISYFSSISELYWQLDSVEFDDNEHEKWYLLNVKKYIEFNKILPVLICDAFYLDKEDSGVRIILNSIAGERDFISSNQYFKPLDDIYVELVDLFKNEEDFISIFEYARENAIKIAKQCKFNISIGERHLPEYKMDPVQRQLHPSNASLFYSLLESAIESKLLGVEDVDMYLDRLQEECRIIEKGGFIDYFLILWDIVEYCKQHNILRGIGRGSAGGSLVSYLLGITHIDPLQYGLLFERFLNESRIKESLPDIDIDFPSESRELVQKYMEQRYGVDQVCAIGTYSTLKLKAALKDLGRVYGINIATLNYINKMIPDDTTFSGLFSLAIENPVIKKFISGNVELVEKLFYILNQPRAKSVHACAMLILPDNKKVYEWIPVRRDEKNGESILVTEWEGVELEILGFLKEDILGIEQLSKFTAILQLIEKYEKVNIDIYDIPLDDKDVYSYFCNGYNSDVFHFGTKGLTSYCIDLQPSSINDLIVGIALYRPGAMDSNFHNEYVLRKSGKREVQFIPGTEDITKDTYGLLCYQEQIMQICEKVGGFSLMEADNIRKAIGKKNQTLLDSYYEHFIQGGIKNGYNVDDVKNLWVVLEKFGRYGFNKSHATAYAITGYICQWLKVHYPLEFWLVALQYASNEDMLGYISEIYNLHIDIGINPPDINYSSIDFAFDVKDKKIFWPINRVRQCGKETVQYILKERGQNGDFFSLDEFLSRVDRKYVNRRVIENFILSGLFDGIEGIQSPIERYSLIKKFYLFYGIKNEPNSDFFIINFDKLQYEWWWILQQKRLSGYGYFDYSNIVHINSFDDSILVNVNEIKGTLSGGIERIVAGIVQSIVVKNSRKGEFAQILIDYNYINVQVIFWNESWSKYKEFILGNEGNILIVSGLLVYDSWRKENILQVNKNSQVKILG